MLRHPTLAALLLTACNDGDERLSRIESRLIEIEVRLGRMESAAAKEPEPEKLLPIEAPRARTGEIGSPVLQIVLTSTGVLLDGVSLTDDELATRFTDAARSDPSASVVIRSEADVPYHRVVEVIDRATSAGLREVSFAAGPEAPAVVSG